MQYGLYVRHPSSQAMSVILPKPLTLHERFKENPFLPCQGNQAEHIIGRRVHGSRKAPADDWNGYQQPPNIFLEEETPPSLFCLAEACANHSDTRSGKI